MVKVITYGTFDLFHYGHRRLLERAKALGDYLIVGVTSDDYDRVRGKINNAQTLMERIAAVRATGLADDIIVEEYDGQKIDDIRRMGVDIFTLGSDWVGKFDYLNEYCQVIYLPRTEGVSSSEIRAEHRKLRIGIVGEASYQEKFIRECNFVNGVEVVGHIKAGTDGNGCSKEYLDCLQEVDAIYITSLPGDHYTDIKTALEQNKHVLCEAPVAVSYKEYQELSAIAESKNLVMMEGIKTAFSTAYERLILLAKSGKIGEIVSVDAVCTSMREMIDPKDVNLRFRWNSMCAWGPTALLPVFQLLGTQYLNKVITTRFLNEAENMDAFTKIDFTYPNAVASVKVAKAAKAEGELIIAGTKGYIYVPAPWWKTDYFELRYENPEDNRRYYYQLDGEGIRYEVVHFARSVENPNERPYISKDVSVAIAGIIEDFYRRKDMIKIGSQSNSASPGLIKEEKPSAD